LTWYNVDWKNALISVLIESGRFLHKKKAAELLRYSFLFEVFGYCVADKLRFSDTVFGKLGFPFGN